MHPTGDQRHHYTMGLLAQRGVGAFGFTQREAAELLGISASSVQKHMERCLSKLRKSLGVWIDA